MNFYDQIRWNLDRLWQQGNEGVSYLLDRLLETPEATEDQDWTFLDAIVVWVARWLFLVVMGVGLYILGRLLWRWWQGRQRRAIAVMAVNPLERPRPVREWLELAQKLQAEEDYGGACRALYMALLVRLDEAGWLRSKPAATNIEYLKDLEVQWALGQRSPQVREEIYQLFQTHTLSYYGRSPISLETLQACQAAYFRVEPNLTATP